MTADNNKSNLTKITLLVLMHHQTFHNSLPTSLKTKCNYSIFKYITCFYLQVIKKYTCKIKL